MDRKEVYAILDGERDYQELRWNADTTSTAGKHTPEEFLLYMEHYMGLARVAMSTQADPQAKLDGLDIMRKVVTLGVACFEQHGVPARQVPEQA